MELRPYQEKALTAFLEGVKLGKRLQVIVLPTGTGKTVLFSQLPPIVKKHGGKKTLILAHREELLVQAKNKLEACNPGIKVGIEQGFNEAPPDSDVIVASVQTLGREGSDRIKKIDPSQIGLIITDECFVAGTKVQGRNIEDIKVGDLVNCLNEETMRIEKKKVTRTFAHGVKGDRLYRFTLSNGKQIVCTEEHPFYINGKWILAKDMKLNENFTDTTILHIITLLANYIEYGTEDSLEKLCCMLGSLSSEVLELIYGSNLFGKVQKSKTGWESKENNTTLQFVLKDGYFELKELIRTSKEVKRILFRSSQEKLSEGTILKNNVGNEQKILLREDEEKQSYEEQRVSGKNEEEYAVKNLSVKRRELKNDNTAIETSQSYETTRQLSGISNKNSDCKKRLQESPAVLQSGYLNTGDKAGNRGRLKDSQIEEVEIPRQKENGSVKCVRLDRIEILERGNGGEFERVCPDNRVYNFEVEEHHNYFVEDILVHNCHHTTASTYRNIYKYFGCDKESGLEEGHPVMLGVTATPSRADNVGLDKIFDELTFKYDIRDAIQDGYLADIKAYTIQTGEDLGNVSVRAGDFAVGELSETVNTHQRNQLIVDSYNKITPNQTAICFAVDVQHAIDLCSKFQENGISAEFVHGGNSTEDRKEIFKRFESGKTKVLTNVGIATEGYDNPEIRGVYLARPTKSNTLYIQMVGRGTRIAPGKEDCKIIDFVDNLGRNSIVSASTIIGLDQPIKANGQSIIGLKEKYEELLTHSPGETLIHIDPDNIEERIKQVDIFEMAVLSEFIKENSKYSWTQFLGGFKISLGLAENGNKVFGEIRENLLGKYEVVFVELSEGATPKFKNGFSKYDKIEVFNKAFDTKLQAIQEADLFIWKNYRSQLNIIKQSASWRDDAPTQKQIELLKRFGYNNADQLSKGQASILLSKHFAENGKRKRPY